MFGDKLCSSLTPLLGTAQVVALAACDSGTVNTFLSRKSLAHALHVTGFPVVIASQLPLTKVGSVILTEELYGGLWTCPLF